MLCISIFDLSILNLKKYFPREISSYPNCSLSYAYVQYIVQITTINMVLVIMIRVRFSDYRKELVRPYYHDKSLIKCTETRSLAQKPAV